MLRTLSLLLILALTLQGVSLAAHQDGPHPEESQSLHLSHGEAQSLTDKAHDDCAHSHCHASHLTGLSSSAWQPPLVTSPKPLQPASFFFTWAPPPRHRPPIC
ncbi:hypothetical protein [Gallaecimonas sp. GXIMD4217]|uniref:hypothetical protein n=1 Tax=Gallaecimonas sp. GXIMD4217 TaxID=3131927 RepID=UPI00311AF643